MIACYSETSWKRPNTGERVSGFVDREEMYRAVESSRQESEPDFPKPAEGKSILLFLHSVRFSFTFCWFSFRYYQLVLIMPLLLFHWFLALHRWLISIL